MCYGVSRLMRAAAVVALLAVSAVAQHESPGGHDMNKAAAPSNSQPSGGGNAGGGNSGGGNASQGRSSYPVYGAQGEAPDPGTKSDPAGNFVAGRVVGTLLFVPGGARAVGTALTWDSKGEKASGGKSGGGGAEGKGGGSSGQPASGGHAERESVVHGKD
jgi:hypothetical protein